MSKSVDITVFIPTYNGEAYIEEILKAIFKQQIDKRYEVLVIDSGSKDRTLDIISRFPQVRLKKIPNSEYGHGKTRQLAAEIANGEIIVYLSHDATPAHNRWLYEITKPFEFQKNIVGVMGKQVPRARCVPLLKYEINAVFRGFGPDFGTTIFYKDEFIKDQAVFDAVRFYSDVNSAARTSVLKSSIPYRDVSYAEDQLFGQDIIQHGLVKAYAPRGLVYHSNEFKFSEYKKRMFDETFGLKKNGIAMPLPSAVTTSKMIFLGSAKDSIKIILDKDYTLLRKIYWLFVNPFYHIEKWRGVRTALKTDIAQTKLNNKSLEYDRRSTDT